MWNNNNQSPPNNYGTPPPFPGANPAFPSPGGFPAPFPDAHPGYQPSYAPPPAGSYNTPPPGPSPGQGYNSYAPPPGPLAGAYHPPPPGPPPGQAYNSYGPPAGPAPVGHMPNSHGPPSNNYTLPPFPPPSHNSGPPPANYGSKPPPAPTHNSYPGPQSSGYPGQQQHQQQSSGYPGQQHRQQHQQPPPMNQNQPYSQGLPPRPPTQAQHYGPTIQGAHHQTQQPYFQYSQCTGKKKALCVGINYTGQKGQLSGCVNDARNIQKFLVSNFGYKEDDIVMLTDDSRNPKQVPTRQNIINAMRWLVAGAAPNDSLFFHFSGHGGQARDTDGDEGDGFDEVIYPLDYEKSGHIVDDMMHDMLVKPLPAGCRLTSIFDSCHSGTALDLPYVYTTEGKVKEPNLAAEAGQGLLSAVSSYAKGDMSGMFKSAMGIVKTATGNTEKVNAKNRATKTSPADVIQWSGCKDSQTSADTQEQGSATGAMSYAFMTVIRQKPQQSYQELLNNIRDILKAKYSQKPQLSASHPMDTNILFVI